MTILIYLILRIKKIKSDLLELQNHKRQVKKKRKSPVKLICVFLSKYKIDLNIKSTYYFFVEY